MPSFTVTIEDTAPIIEYSSDWRAGTSEDDSSADKYSQSSFTVTSSDGASMSFSFCGNAVQIFGSKRPNHGNYQVELDGHVYPVSSGVASDPGNFQVSLFTASALEDGSHTVTLTNRGGSFLDVDFISWDTNIGEDNDQIVLNMFQDDNPSFSYSPSSSWSNRPNRAGTFMGGSGHVTTKSDGAVQFQFKGDGVAIYGPVGPDGGPYSVQVDGHDTQNFTTNKDFYRPQMMLYYANHLGAGSHTVKLSPLVSNSSSSSQVLAIDYAVVYVTGSLESSVGANYANVHPGTIAGLSIGATIAFFLLLAAIILIWKRIDHRKRWRTRQHRKEEIDPIPKVEPFGYASVPESRLNSNVHLNELMQPSSPGPSLIRLSPMSTPNLRPSTLSLSEASSAGINRYDIDTSGVSSLSFHDARSYTESSDGYRAQSRPLLRHVNSVPENAPYPLSAQNGVDTHTTPNTGKAAMMEVGTSHRRRISEVPPEYSQ